MSRTPLSDGQQLLEALKCAAPGAVITLDAPRYDLDDDILLDRPITLRGLSDPPPILHFVDGRFAMSIAADDCHLQSIAMTGSGHRGTPLISVTADHCSLTGVSIIGSQGSGLAANDCRRLTVEDLRVLDCGQQAASFSRCRDLNVAISARAIGQRAAAPAIRLVDCLDFVVDADVAEVNGSAIAVENTPECAGPIGGQVTLRARKAQRALSLLGQRHAPIRAVDARVDAANWTECALLLSNAQGVKIDLMLRAPAAPASVRLNGGFGVRDSVIDVSRPADLPSLILGREGNPDIVIREHVRHIPDAADDAVFPDCSAALLDNLRQIARPAFTPYELAGRCSLCGWEGMFRRTHASERETLACEVCRATLRYRGQAAVIVDRLGEGRVDTLAGLVEAGMLSGLDIFEPGFAGPFRRWLGQARRYEKSFYDPDLPSGTRRGDMTCQDLMATSFADDSFDLVLTSDIFEHVRKPFAAFAEVRRILRPGGLHIWTVPMAMPPPAETRSRVDTSGPQDRMLLPPVYHGSGADSLSLVYTDFGRDIGARLAAIGLPTTAVRHPVVNGRVAGVSFVSIKAEPTDA